MDHLPLMARFNAWVNARLYGVVAGLSDEAYRRDRKAFFGSIHNTLNHLLLVDRLWTGRIQGVDHGIAALTDILYDDFDELRAARTAMDAHLVDLVDGLDDDARRATIPYRRILGNGEERARCDHMLITLFNHQTHHRGQVHCMLTQDGIEPPALDVIFFLDEIDPT